MGFILLLDLEFFLLGIGLLFCSYLWGVISCLLI
uniref:Uncharacterized protein n=1 Tax=Manihot esculenta TaxID=3983 RepID=A0A2C9UDD3_MANES